MAQQSLDGSQMGSVLRYACMAWIHLKRACMYRDGVVKASVERAVPAFACGLRDQLARCSKAGL